MTNGKSSSSSDFGSETSQLLSQEFWTLQDRDEGKLGNGKYILIQELRANFCKSISFTK